ncbi:MAG: guanylate kinase [Gemmatimonadetes bacterium]|nr:guanylate kinase [Gemmatimonadota bacterium]
MSERRPLLVLAAPSGAGKTTLARALVERNDELVFSLSATTRPPRPGERDGRDYHFVDDAGFDRLIEQGELLESATVHGHRYGTLRWSVEAALDRGKTVVLDIDVQGADQIRKAFPDAILVFILPPSAAELLRRLQGRGSERAPETGRRIRTAVRELDAADDFDYVIVNDDLDAAIGVLGSILAARPHETDRPQAMRARIAELRTQLTRWIEERTNDESLHAR